MASPLERSIQRGPTLYCGGDRGHLVALTFDDGPGLLDGRVLSLLRRAHQEATFFLIGEELSSYPRYVSEEAALGAVGDHTWTHPFLTRLPRRRVRVEIARTKTALERLSGAPVRLFRPPYGFHNATVDHVVSSLGMLQVKWSLDSHDAYPDGGLNSSGIGARVARFLRPGSIVLLHDERAATVEALARSILPLLDRRGLRSVTIPELLAADPPSPAQLRQGINGCPEGRLAS